MIEGRYRLERKLGEGGYGVVFAAIDEADGREVALKFLGRHAATRREGIARFEREARIVRELTHPNIVQTLGLGKTADGVPFLVLELLKGETLGARIARVGSLGLETTVHVGEQILKALGAAHDRGIVHRDIKPDNIFLSQVEGAPDVARLLDFGVAHLRWDDGPTLTRASTVLGTPAYMAPEQVVGGPIDGRTDLYAMGLVLAECIEGAVVMGDGNPVKIALQHAAPEPIVLGPRVLGSPLRTAIERAVTKDRAGRPADARELLRLFPPRVTRPLSEIETAPTALASIPDEISRDLPSSPGPLEPLEEATPLQPAPPPDPPEPPTIRGRTPPSGVAGRGFTAPTRPVMVAPAAAGQASSGELPMRFEPTPATVRIGPTQASSSNKVIAIVVGALIAAALVAAGGWFFLVRAQTIERPAPRGTPRCTLAASIDDVVIAGTRFEEAEAVLLEQKFVADEFGAPNQVQRSYFNEETSERINVVVYPPGKKRQAGSYGQTALAELDGCRVAITRTADKGAPKQTAEATMREIFPRIGAASMRAE